MNINEINKKSWNKQAERYQQNADFSFNNVDYGDIRCKTEEDLKLLGDVKGKKIFELGCGGANCGIALAKQGAIVTCTDISEEQIKFAKENAKKEEVNIKFIVSSMESLVLEEKEFDIVISVCAMMYVENIDKVYKNVSNVLKDKGVFVFSLNDPTFYSIAAKYLWNDPDNCFKNHYPRK